MPDPAVPALLVASNPGVLTGDGNNTWLLDGAEPTLIDAGLGDAAHVDAVADALRGRPLCRLLATHGHGDHVRGRPMLAARWPDLVCLKAPDPADVGWLPLADGDIVCAGDRRLRVVATPGHAPDHVCFWDEPAQALYAGDMVLAGTTVMIPAGRGGHLGQYLASLQRLIALSPRVIYPGHRNVIDRPVELMTKYVEHRLTRERQILACLPETGPDLEAIVRRVYPRLAPALLGAAKLTVQAHLDKIREDGLS